MRKTAAILGLVGAFAFAPAVSSQAGDEGWAALGGFIGGTIFSGVAHGSHHAAHHGHHGHHAYRPPPTHTVVHHYEPPPRPRGHYEYVKKKVWTSGYWDHGYDECGREIKVWVDGYYTVKTVKVWVPHHNKRRGHHKSRQHYASCR